MRARRLTAATVFVVAALSAPAAVSAQDDESGFCCKGGFDGGADTGDEGGAPFISSWAIGVPGGGVQAPSGVTCTAWRPAAEITVEDGAIDVATVGVDPDGVRRNLYYRDCGPVRQLVWVRDEDPTTLATMALSDLQRRLIVAPVPELSPPTVGYVNLETWLATADPGQLSATAAIPGLTVTATATVESTEWSTGDGTDITCDGVGTPWTPGTPDDEPAPCGHTYVAHGSTEYGSTPFTITVTQTWHVTWEASNGAGGDLGTITGPGAAITYEVREIQTIGIQG